MNDWQKNGLPVLAGLVCGILLTLVIFANASVARITSPISASFLTHLIGFQVAAVIMFWSRRTLLTNFSGVPKWTLLGGVWGGLLVVTETITVNSGFCFAASLGLFLLGQILMSALVDQAGIFGMKKIKINRWQIFEILLVGFGCYCLILASNQ